MKKTILLALILLLSISTLFSKEGMWIPILLEKYNIEEMQQMGFKLTAQDIFDVNNSSMKDAVVLFGGGCTGEIISDDGLLITNYHCGLSRIQSHSSIENDYLTDGFWAMNRGEELPNRGLSVQIMEYMEDVTERVLEGTVEIENEQEKEKIIQSNIQKIRSEASEDGKFETSVKPLFYGNQYFLYVYKVFNDVRLVGAPPSAIGKFGGDTDNWMWPRHTGDFSLFRIYTNKNNEPASYSEDNIPYKPKKFFPISMKGIKPDDFTMVFGFPGSTMQYIPSEAVKLIMDQRDPDRISIRDKKLEIIYNEMEKDPKVRIQYAAKVNGISNSWKKWQGEIKGLKRLDAVSRKIRFEDEFKSWAIENGLWENKYKEVFSGFEEKYKTLAEYIKASDYYSETVFRGAEIFSMAAQVNSLISFIENGREEDAQNRVSRTIGSIENVIKNQDWETDEKQFAALLSILVNDLDYRFVPQEVIQLIQKSDDKKLIQNVYQKSVLSDFDKLKAILESGNMKKVAKLKKDPIIELYRILNSKFETEINPVVNSLNNDIDALQKTYMEGIMKLKEGQPLYADANLTLRVSYGKVEGYEPVDGVKYNYYTTLKGIMEKDNPEIYDYDVPDALKEIYEKKDYGPYSVDGEVPVCFIASNHTTGGNSGSPVVNGDGQLIGINFDRCWEGTMSDIMFDPDQCRNIILDVRYAMFLIDKFAGAGYLLDEMELIWE
ncbi:MAG: S46 family peptidase [Prolixibacteraceae bacterium]|nr:S46 family peptidase [Prolixibacteraceae bacterium]MBN2773812.1 S46 family peptidase [Prolixibacteraceae bacterium]